jgi:endoglycosylceramidase
MVYKRPPYYPAAVGFGDDDAAFLQSIGFNAVRVGVIWKAVEPSPGVFDDAYLQQIASTVHTLANHGIVSMLDFHQDLLNELFQGEGAPDWAVSTGGLPDPAFGFPRNYILNPALEHALDQLWQNHAHLQDRFGAAWTHVASVFANDTSVLGYELFNEPFPGTLWEQCALPTGCPVFDSQLTTFYRRVDRSIRTVDPRTLVWYEPNVLFNDGVPSDLGSIQDRAAGFAFHDYCLTDAELNAPLGCDAFDDLVFQNAIDRAASTHNALLETEFGGTSDVSLLDAMVARADKDMVPWLEWSYCPCNDPTGATADPLVIDPALPPAGSNLGQVALNTLVEPYPELIAGTPKSWGFTRSTGTFRFTYVTAKAGGGGAFPAGSITEIATPPVVYARGYAVDASGGRIVSAPNAGVLQVASCPGSTAISVSVAPVGSSRGSC